MQYVIVICSISVRETQRGNPETLSTLDTHDIRRRQTKHKSTTQHRKLKRSATRTPPRKAANPGTRGTQANPAS